MLEPPQRTPQPPFVHPGDSGLPLKEMAATFGVLLLATLAIALTIRAAEGEPPPAAPNAAAPSQPAPLPQGPAPAPGGGAPVEQREREKGELRIVTGDRQQRGRLTVIFPRQIGRWERLPIIVRGVSRPAPQQAGSAWIAIAFAHGRCPARRPLPRTRGVLQGPAFMVYADEPFHGAGNYVMREQHAQRLQLCGYLGENSTKPPVPGPELVVESTVELLDQPRRPLSPGEGYLEPGTYRAAGRAVRGAGRQASIEFDVRLLGKPSELRTLTTVRFSGLRPRRCDRDGAELRTEGTYALRQPVVGETFDAVDPQLGVGLTGGTAEGRKARGQLFIDYGACTAAIRFVATP